MDRFERLLDLVHVISASRAPLSFTEIKGLFPDYQGNHDAARRKFERDKTELENIGIEVHYVAGEEEGEGGYLLPQKKAFLPQLDLTKEERNVLAATIQSALLDENFPFRKALRHAYTKLDPDPDMATNLGLDNIAVESVSQSVLEQLFYALSNQKLITFSYTKIGEGSEEREMQIHRLFVDRGRWYVSGHDVSRQAQRVFRCARMNNIVVNPKRPAKPDYVIPPTSESKKRLQAPHLFAVHKAIEVRFELAPELRFLVERKWKPTYQEDVGVVSITNTEGFVEQALELGNRITIVGPPEIRQAMKKRIESTIARLEAT